MKKFLTVFLGIIMSLSVFGLTACKNDNDAGKISVYVPDGAPALSVAKFLDSEDLQNTFSVNVVSSNEIKVYVSGENPKADICVLPVNLASKLLGDGSVYSMLGTVTHGNLFIMKTEGQEDVTLNNIQTLKGKKVGVLNLANVPGLTFKAILSDNGLSYEDITETGEVKQDKVNLIGFTKGEDIKPGAGCDYYVVPEPAATTKQAKTNGKLSIAGSLQELYEGGNGYPQAVAVAKNSVISDNLDAVEKFMNGLTENENWLADKNVSAEDIVNAVKKGFSDSEMSPTFTADNLNAEVLSNCAVHFQTSAECKQNVLDYLKKINAVSNNAWGTPSDNFFWNK